MSSSGSADKGGCLIFFQIWKEQYKTEFYQFLLNTRYLLVLWGYVWSYSTINIGSTKSEHCVLVEIFSKKMFIRHSLQCQSEGNTTGVS